MNFDTTIDNSIADLTEMISELSEIQCKERWAEMTLAEIIELLGRAKDKLGDLRGRDLKDFNPIVYVAPKVWSL